MPRAKKSHLGFRLSGVEPQHDIAWHLAGEKGRKAYWKEAARVGLQVKDRSLARGLGADGEDLADITQYTRDHRHSAMGRARASAPPLTPARRLSRTRSYLRAFEEHDGVWFAWRFDHRTGASWGLILSYQAKRGRDVFGFSPSDLAEIRRRMDAWWRRCRVKWAVAGSVSAGAMLEPMAMAVPPSAVGARDAGPAPRPAARPVNLGLATFHSDAQADAYRRAVAAGRNLGPNRGDTPRTTPRLIKR